MVYAITYSMSAKVTGSWDRLKTIPNYKEITGELIFTKLFELEPTARRIFKISDINGDIQSDPMFKLHSKAMVMMINGAVELLGPDLDLLEEDLQQLGTRHVRYGVKIESLKHVKKAVDHALTQILGETYVKTERISWIAILDYMIENMILGMKTATYKMTANVTMSWSLLKTTPQYEDVAGELIYTKLFELVPSARELFKIGESDDNERSTGKQFRIHGRAMVYMIDRAVEMLGPNLDPLDDALVHLGKRHVNYWVDPKFLPYMGKAVDHAMSNVLGSKYTKRDKESWQTIMDFMASKMIAGMIE